MCSVALYSVSKLRAAGSLFGCVAFSFALHVVVIFLFLYDDLEGCLSSNVFPVMVEKYVCCGVEMVFVRCGVEMLRST